MTVFSDQEPLVIWATPEHEKCGRHRAYAMSCDQFDGLLERASGHCELCGADRLDSAWGCLHIDHEHQVGKWAVRGLLCDACNLKLQRGRRLPPTAPLQRYIANVWWRQQLDQLGLSDEAPDEPGLGSTILAMRRSWMRLTTERERCWATHRGSEYTFKTWPELWYEYGPMSLEIRHERDSLPRYVKDMYGQELKAVAYFIRCDKRREKAAQ